MRVRLSPQVIVDRALELVDREGFSALTLSAVADALDVRPSALYTYVSGLVDLEYLVAVASTENLVDDVRQAAIGTSGSKALLAMGAAYRAFSLEHPGQFASTLLPPRSNDDELALQNQRLLDVFITVFEAIGIADDTSYLAARATRSALHGFLALEHNSGTTTGHDAEYDHLLRTLQRGLLTEAESTPTAPPPRSARCHRRRPVPPPADRERADRRRHRDMERGPPKRPRSVFLAARTGFEPVPPPSRPSDH